MNKENTMELVDFAESLAKFMKVTSSKEKHMDGAER